MAAYTFESTTGAIDLRNKNLAAGVMPARPLPSAQPRHLPLPRTSRPSTLTRPT